MTYTIEFSATAEKSFRKLPRGIQEYFSNKFDTLRNNPCPEFSSKLKPYKDVYRIRHGDYRMVYRVIDNSLLVLIIRVGHRKEVYQKLFR